MRLLQIGASWLSYQFSGLERYYAELVARLPGLGAQVTALAYELQDPPVVPGLELLSFGTQKKSVARQFFDQRRLVKRCLRRGTDLVVSHCTPSLYPSLKQLGGTPLVCHFHGPRYLERIVEGAHPISVRISRYIERRVYARAQHMIVLSRYMKRVLVDTYGFPEESISVIPGGVNLDQFKQRLSRAEARDRLGLPAGRSIVVAVRRLERRMGLDNLLEAVGTVVEKEPRALLLIAGKGPLEEQLRRQVAAHDLARHVRVLGAVSDRELPLLYRAADFSIVPTTAYEGFGLIIVESLAAGTPVLGTPVGAIPEVLAPLSKSLLLDGTEPQDLARGMLEMLSGARARPSMEACESYAAENYAWSVIAPRIHAIYREVVDAHAKLMGSRRNVGG